MCNSTSNVDNWSNDPLNEGLIVFDKCFRFYTNIVKLTVCG